MVNTCLGNKDSFWVNEELWKFNFVIHGYSFLVLCAPHLNVHDLLTEAQTVFNALSATKRWKFFYLISHCRKHEHFWNIEQKKVTNIQFCSIFSIFTNNETIYCSHEDAYIELPEVTFLVSFSEHKGQEYKQLHAILETFNRRITEGAVQWECSTWNWIRIDDKTDFEGFYLKLVNFSKNFSPSCKKTTLKDKKPTYGPPGVSERSEKRRRTALGDTKPNNYMASDLVLDSSELIDYTKPMYNPPGESKRHKMTFGDKVWNYGTGEYELPLSSEGCKKPKYELPGDSERSQKRQRTNMTNKEHKSECNTEQAEMKYFYKNSSPNGLNQAVCPTSNKSRFISTQSTVVNCTLKPCAQKHNEEHIFSESSDWESNSTESVLDAAHRHKMITVEYRLSDVISSETEPCEDGEHRTTKVNGFTKKSIRNYLKKHKFHCRKRKVRCGWRFPGHRSKRRDHSSKHSTLLVKESIDTLKVGHWLNDDIINSYLTLISSKSKYKIYVFSTFFYTCFQKKGYDGVSRWTRKVDIFQYDLVMFPVHLGAHWVLVVAHIPDKVITYYDSMNISTRSSSCNKVIMNYLIKEQMTKHNHSHKWMLETGKDVPEQRKNSDDCGVFLCLYAKCLALDLPMMFTQNDIKMARKLMIKEISTGRIFVKVFS